MSVQDVFATPGTTNVSPTPVCQQTTANATPVDLCMVPLEPGSTLVVRALIIARNQATGASKVWDITVSAKRVGSGNASIEGNTGLAAPIVSAGDSASMSAVAIAGALSGGSVGVRCTGLAATNILWVVTMDGVTIN